MISVVITLNCNQMDFGYELLRPFPVSITTGFNPFSFRAPGFYASHVLRPEFRDGIRMLSYEIMTQLNWHIPDAVVMPVSAGTLLLGVIYGFRHLLNSGEISRIPQIIAVQTEFVSPLYHRMEGLQYNPPRSYVSVADALVSQSPPLLDETGSC